MIGYLLFTNLKRCEWEGFSQWESFANLFHLFMNHHHLGGCKVYIYSVYEDLPNVFQYSCIFFLCKMCCYMYFLNYFYIYSYTLPDIKCIIELLYLLCCLLNRLFCFNDFDIAIPTIIMHVHLLLNICLSTCTSYPPFSYSCVLSSHIRVLLLSEFWKTISCCDGGILFPCL